MRCHFCEQEKEGLPFRCNYCGEAFCGEHRLPENHACPRIGGPLQPGYSGVVRPPRNAPRQKESNRNYPTIRSGRSRFRLRYAGLFSPTETKHILGASAVMVMVGISILYFSSYVLNPILLLILVPGFLACFIGHELAHKFLAQRNGLWAEFRTNPYGLMMTLVSVILPIKFLAPGQTNIQGTGRKEILGAIGLIGPGLNIALGFVFVVLERITTGNISLAFWTLVIYNSWLAIFNLIPFGTFDGTRVFEWDKTRWAIAFAAAVILTVLAYVPNLLAF